MTDEMKVLTDVAKRANLNNGCIFKPDSEGLTLLMRACKNGYFKVILYILKKYEELIENESFRGNIYINNCNDDGVNAFMMLPFENYHEDDDDFRTVISKFMLYNRGEVDILDETGKTLLMRAVVQNDPQRVRGILTACEPNITVVSSEGQTAYGIAESNNFQECMDAIIKHDTKGFF